MPGRSRREQKQRTCFDKPDAATRTRNSYFQPRRAGRGPLGKARSAGSVVCFQVMDRRITFLGAAETVTGSKHLLTLGDANILVDCGMFQGGRELRDRNWRPLKIDPGDIDAVIVTHAHMDHIGWLPRLVSQGYAGPIYATPATIALSRISLLDSGRLQEEDAAYANRKSYSRHKPALPLYTEQQAGEALQLFQPVRYDIWRDLPGGASWRFLPAGHILGSAFAENRLPGGGTILMSGDLGRFDMPIIKDPVIVEQADFLVVESTYGDRLHPKEDTAARLEQVIKSALQSGSAIVVPSFAIGRTQELLYFIHKLQDENRLPAFPIFVDSPMATSTTTVFSEQSEEYDAEMLEELRQGDRPLQPESLVFTRDVQASKALNDRRGPMMIIAGSGMANGGRILHHLKQRLPDSNTIVLFTGYQAVGTLGRQLIEGAPEVKIHGQVIPVRASVEKMNALSAHADQGEILKWLGGFKKPPKRTFIVHGEPPPQAALKARIVEELGWDVVIPKWEESFPLV